MVRDLSRLTATEHDLLVIGGGISGLIAAYDGAQRGLSVALIDRGDFGSATSFNHLKTVHGGLRYLQHGDIARMRRSVLERQTFARIAPHLVTPLPFLARATTGLARSRAAYAAAFAIDSWIGRDRNAGLRDSLHLPAGRVISRAECRRLAPQLDLEGSTGGALWYDYQMPWAERLTFAFALAAHAHGAALANYVEALAPIVRDNSIIGVTARDVESHGESFEIRARVTLNAAGPWARAIMASCGIGRPVLLLKAMNLVTSRIAEGPALVRSNPRGRALVLAPWHGRALIGTSESAASCGPDDRGVGEDELADFVGEVNATFPHLNLRGDEVTMVHRGSVPAVVHNGHVTLRGEAQVLDHASDGLPGLVTMVCVKYTTARLLAEQALDLVVRKLDRGTAPSRTASVPLPGVPPEGSDLVAALLRDHAGWLEAFVARHLAATHGTGCQAIATLASQDPALRAPIAPALPVLQAEVAHAARHEMARTLIDVVARRTLLGTAGHPGQAVARTCAEVLAKELRWGAARVSAEFDALRAFYDPVTAIPSE
jgi:glycerol-3-phosphate dehydrogenase